MRMKDKLIIGKNAIDTPTDFETIQEGIDYLAGLPDSHPKVLIVKEGRYDEYIESRLSNFKLVGARSEERRVGKECRSRLSPYH